MTATTRHSSASAIGAMTAAVRHAAAIGAMTATVRRASAIGVMTATFPGATPATTRHTAAAHATAMVATTATHAAATTVVSAAIVGNIAIASIIATATASTVTASAVEPASAAIIATRPTAEAMKPFAPVAVMIIKLMEAIAMEAITTKPSALEAVEPVMNDDGAVEVKRTVEPRMREVEVVPGARADKHAVHKPVGAVVTVGSAAKRIRWIKTVGANRRRIVNAVTWADLNADGNLRLCIRHGQNQQSQ